MSFGLAGGNNAINVGGPGGTIGLTSGTGDVLGGSSAQWQDTTVSGLLCGIQIDINDMVPGAASFALGYSGNSLVGTLSVTDGTHSTSLYLVGGSHTSSQFMVASDGHGGTLITYNG